MGPPAVASDVLPRPADVERGIRRVAEAVLAERVTSPATSDWQHAVLYLGLLSAYRATGDLRYQGWVRNRVEALGWEVEPGSRMADHHAIAQVYLELHTLVPDGSPISGVRAAIDSILERPTPGSRVGWDYRLNWSWADALFMAPASWTALSRITGRPRYAEAMDTLWWETTEHLYDAEVGLFHRDGSWLSAEDPRRVEVGGREVFWARGNGWVLAGLARVLATAPETFASRARYVALFRTLADRLVLAQQPDGLWRTDLTHPARYPLPESSASALITYALAWGVSEGVLQTDPYRSVVARAWNGLSHLVLESGRVGWAQEPAQQPGPVDPLNAEPYATGAYLMAAHQVLEMLTVIPSRPQPANSGGPGSPADHARHEPPRPGSSAREGRAAARPSGTRSPSPRSADLPDSPLPEEPRPRPPRSSRTPDPGGRSAGRAPDPHPL